jgi:Domain of unknown function (DUF1830)
MPLTSSAPAIAEQTSNTLCQYSNTTSTMQRIRLVNSVNYSSEIILFPSQKISFKEIPEGRLEVYLDRKGKKVLEKVLYCYTLRAKS